MSRRGSRPPNTSLYVRNIPDHARQDDIRQLFSKYGPVTDVYVPLDHYTREPRGFCYVHTFEYVRDAEDAMYALDRTRFLNREMDIQFAEGDRKTPNQMRGRDMRRGRRRSRSRSPYYDRRSRSRSPYYRRRSRSRSPYRSRRSFSRSHSRSRTPERRRKRRSYSRSHSRSRSRSHSRSRSRSR